MLPEYRLHIMEEEYHCERLHDLCCGGQDQEIVYVNNKDSHNFFSVELQEDAGVGVRPFEAQLLQVAGGLQVPAATELH